MQNRVVQVLSLMLVSLGSAAYLAAADSESTVILDFKSSPKTAAPLLLPFASKPEESRSYRDYELNADLSGVDEFRILYSVNDAAALGSVTLYLRSGNGWYSLPGKRTGESEISFPAWKYTTEGTPLGRDKIDGIRLSFWKGGAVDSEVTPLRLDAVTHSLGIVVPRPDDPSSESRPYATQLGKMLEELGIPFGWIPQESLPEYSFKNKKIAVLPMNGEMSRPEIEALERFLDENNGGKLIAFYQLPKELLEKLGFENPRYAKPAGENAIGGFRLEKELPRSLLGTQSLFPESVRQRSWNLTAVTPKPERKDAVIAAYWFDHAGIKTVLPALCVSDTGAFFTHVMLGGDTENKARLLLALLGAYDPEIINAAIEKQIQTIRSIGRESTWKNGDADFTWKVSEPMQSEFSAFMKRADTIAKVSDPDGEKSAAVFLMSAEIKDKMTKDYIASVQGKKNEFRGWWEHAGTGAYPGDWDRTMMELSDAGFTAVFPNMLWGGLAHYESDLLPRSQVYEKYGDQIAQAVAAGKKYGVEVHVWKVNFNASTATNEFIEQMRKEGRLQRKIDGAEQPWLCPSHPDNRKLECDAMLEVARKYDVTGIHFDYIRYPDRNYCFCDGCNQRFSEYLKTKNLGSIKQWPGDCTDGELRDSFDDWRREQITQLVADVHTAVKAIKPGLKVSAAVFPGYPACRKWELQDWGLWIDKGYLDFVCPMDYQNDPKAFGELVRLQNDVVKHRIPLYPGIGATATGIHLGPGDVTLQIEIARKIGAEGFTIFNLYDDTMDRIAKPLSEGPTRKTR